MMRKPLGFVALAGLVAIAAANLAPSSLLDFSKALQDAKTLKANYSVQTIGGTAERYTVELKKPNLVHVESPTQIVVSDGKEMTVFEKAEGYYYKQPATEAAIGSVFQPEPLNVWAGFFNPKALKASASRSLGVKNRAGLALDAVEATYDAGRVITYFLDNKDKIARQAQIDLSSSAGKRTFVVNAKDVTVGGDIPDSAFVFKAPEGSRETTLEALNADRWYTDLDEAKAAASKSGKKIFVDFMATWCGPCKKLDAEVLQTERFKSIAKKSFVLLRIDVDVQKSVSSAYNIEAMPTQMVLDKAGTVLGTTVGYGSPDAFYQFLMPFAK